MDPGSRSRPLQEAFRWDDSVWEKLNFYDGFGRVVLVIGARAPGRQGGAGLQVLGFWEF